MTYAVPVGNDVDVLKNTFPLDVWTHAQYCYSRGVRGYHVFEHACDVMTRVLYLNEHVGFMDVNAAMLAALFHDAVYVVGAPNGHNEVQSGDQMYNAFTYTRSHNFDLSCARDMIYSTADHLKPRGDIHRWDTSLLMDCDMLGFADSQYRFATQQHLIDVEYGQDPSNPSRPYLHGRVSFLTKLKDRGVFVSPPVRRWFEDRALANIDRELERCRKALAKQHDCGVECV